MKSNYPGITNYLQLKSATIVPRIWNYWYCENGVYVPYMALHIEDSGEICMQLTLYCARPYLDIIIITCTMF